MLLSIYIRLQLSVTGVKSVGRCVGFPCPKFSSYGCSLFHWGGNGPHRSTQSAMGTIIHFSCSKKCQCKGQSCILVNGKKLLIVIDFEWETMHHFSQYAQHCSIGNTQVSWHRTTTAYNIILWLFNKAVATSSTRSERTGLHPPRVWNAKMSSFLESNDHSPESLWKNGPLCKFLRRQNSRSTATAFPLFS